MLHEISHSVCGVETTEAAAVNAALLDRPDLMIIDARLGNGTISAACFSRTLSTRPVTVTTPAFAVTPTWAAVTLGFQASSARTAC